MKMRNLNLQVRKETRFYNFSTYRDSQITMSNETSIVSSLLCKINFGCYRMLFSLLMIAFPPSNHHVCSLVDWLKSISYQHKMQSRKREERQVEREREKDCRSRKLKTRLFVHQQTVDKIQSTSKSFDVGRKLVK